MTPEPLSKANLKTLRNIGRAKFRSKEGLFAAEGRRLIEEGLRANVPLKFVVVASSQLSALEGLPEIDEGRLYQLDDDLFDEVSDTVNSQGLLAIFERRPAALNAGEGRVTLVIADNLRDPGNMGTLIRNAVAFGVDHLLLTSGCVDPWNPKAVRSTMGGIFHLPIQTGLDPLALQALLHQGGIEVRALDLAEGADNAMSAELPDRLALVVGGETEGIGEGWRSVKRLQIPQSERIDSLNAAVSAAIVLARRFSS